MEEEIGSVSDLARVADGGATESGARCWFRGQSDKAWHLVPFVFRNDPHYETSKAVRFRSRAPARMSSPPPHDDYAAWLTLMTHHGAPTRLLDWSESIVVAAYFAVCANSPTDAAIWQLNPAALNRIELGKEGIYGMRSDAVIAAFGDAFGAPRTKRPPWKAAAVHGDETDLRMLVQQAAFTIHMDKTPLEQLSDNAQFLKKFKIPSDARRKIRGELSLIGVRRATLFPDLDGLASDLASARFTF